MLVLCAYLILGQMLKDKNDEPSLKKIQPQDIFADLLRYCKVTFSCKNEISLRYQPRNLALKLIFHAPHLFCDC